MAWLIWARGVPPWVWSVLAGVVVIVGAGVWLRGHDRRVIAAREAAVVRVEAPAREAAAAARVRDAVANGVEREDYHAAIDAVRAAGAPDPADVALACERLRRAGFARPAGC